jgi:hypothetical protein
MLAHKLPQMGTRRTEQAKEKEKKYAQNKKGFFHLFIIRPTESAILA